MRILVIGGIALACYRANHLDESGVVYLGEEPGVEVAHGIVVPVRARPRDVLMRSGLVWSDSRDTRLILCAAERDSTAVMEALTDFPWLIRRAGLRIIEVVDGGRNQQRHIDWLWEFARRHGMPCECVQIRYEDDKLRWPHLNLPASFGAGPVLARVSDSGKPLLIALEHIAWRCVRKIPRECAEVMSAEVLCTSFDMVRGKTILLVADLARRVTVPGETILSLGQHNRVWPLLLWPGSDSGRGQIREAQCWVDQFLDGCFAVPMVTAVDPEQRPLSFLDIDRLPRRKLRRRVDQWMTCWSDKCQIR